MRPSAPVCPVPNGRASKSPIEWVRTAECYTGGITCCPALLVIAEARQPAGVREGQAKKRASAVSFNMLGKDATIQDISSALRLVLVMRHASRPHHGL